MTPLGMVLIYCAGIVVAVRVPLILSPKTHAERLRRVFFPSAERLRVVGIGMLVLLAAPLLLVARTAPAGQPGRGWVEALGWLVVAGGTFVVVAPKPALKLIDGVMSAASSSVLRGVGLVNLAFAAFLVWAAFAIS